MSWDPQQYLKFEGERLRPAIDLLNRVPLSAPRSIVDLGCGTGNVTRLIGARFPSASIVGVDGSAAMLAKAHEAIGADPRFSFVEADLASWAPPTPVDRTGYCSCLM